MQRSDMPVAQQRPMMGTGPAAPPITQPGVSDQPTPTAVRAAHVPQAPVMPPATGGSPQVAAVPYVMQAPPAGPVPVAPVATVATPLVPPQQASAPVVHARPTHPAMMAGAPPAAMHAAPPLPADAPAGAQVVPTTTTSSVVTAPPAPQVAEVPTPAPPAATTPAVGPVAAAAGYPGKPTPEQIAAAQLAELGAIADAEHTSLLGIRELITRLPLESYSTGLVAEIEAILLDAEKKLVRHHAQVCGVARQVASNFNLQWPHGRYPRITQP
jgi:hypothetical protein